MISKIHNTETCDCEMCVWADKQEREQVLHSITESVVEIPDFDSNWESAPRSKCARVERDDAEYWYVKGQQAMKIEMMLAHNQDLNEMARIARERRSS